MRVCVVLPLFLDFVCGIRSVFPNRNLLQKPFCLVKYVDRCIPINTPESNYFLWAIYVCSLNTEQRIERVREREAEKIHTRQQISNATITYSHQFSHRTTILEIRLEQSQGKKFLAKNTRNQMDKKKAPNNRTNERVFFLTRSLARYSSHQKNKGTNSKSTLMCWTDIEDVEKKFVCNSFISQYVCMAICLVSDNVYSKWRWTNENQWKKPDSSKYINCVYVWAKGAMNGRHKQTLPLLFGHNI